MFKSNKSESKMPQKIKIELEQGENNKVFILEQLVECVKDINYDKHECGKSFSPESELSSTLCSIIESIFLHGFQDKKTLRKSLVNLFDIGETKQDRYSQINFWPVLLIISHNQILDSIQNLSQINSDVGYCRAWIRSTINEHLLSGYLLTIIENIALIKNFYCSWSFLRDVDKLTITTKLIESMESVEFKIPLNSSLLNKWPSLTLELVGMHAESNLSISSGIDVVNDTNYLKVQTNEKTRPNNEVNKSKLCSLKTKISKVITKEDELASILENTIIINEHDSLELLTSESKSSKNSKQLPNDMFDKESSAISSEKTNQEIFTKSITNKIILPVKSTILPKNSSEYNADNDNQDFSLLLLEHYEHETHQNRLLNQKPVWDLFKIYLNEYNNCSTDIIHSKKPKYSVEQLRIQLERLCKLNNELGLDEQGYQCRACSSPLGIGIIKQK